MFVFEIYLRGNDLRYLLKELDNFYLDYRNNLYFPSDITFGVKIEYEEFFRMLTDRFVKKNMKEWKVVDDASLILGGEVISPILKDNEVCWKELKLICDYLLQRRADTLHNAGGHIHIGVNVLGERVDSWRIFFKLYMIYENILFRFAYGDKVSGREDILDFAYPVRDLLYKRLSLINDARTGFDFYGITLFDNINDEDYALNFENVDFFNLQSKHYKNTLEFRFPNASVNAVIWQNNINALVKLLVASRSDWVDEDFLNYKLKHKFISYEENEFMYNDIDLKGFLEFVDLVFNNNLDKIYFLRQYLRDYQEYEFNVPTVKAKKFYK